MRGGRWILSGAQPAAERLGLSHETPELNQEIYSKSGGNMKQRGYKPISEINEQTNKGWAVILEYFKEAAYGYKCEELLRLLI